MLAGKSRIEGEIPAAGQPVRMQDQQWIAGEIIGELADARRHVAGGAVMRHHMLGRLGGDQRAADIADPDISHHPRRLVDPRHGDRGAARRHQHAMDPLNHVLARFIRVLQECPHREVCRPRRLDAVAGAIRHHDGAALRGFAECPVVAADLLAGIRRDRGPQQRSR
jgi:hypothetical protein